MKDLLGLPLAEALAAAGSQAQPQIVETAAPRLTGQERQNSTLRVIRIQGNQWTVARFVDGLPRQEKDE